LKPADLLLPPPSVDNRYKQNEFPESQEAQVEDIPFYVQVFEFQNLFRTSP
jgi:hypothetical protein